MNRSAIEIALAGSPARKSYLSLPSRSQYGREYQSIEPFSSHAAFAIGRFAITPIFRSRAFGITRSIGS